MEQAPQIDIEASVEMAIGKMQNLPTPPMTQEEVRLSLFQKAIEHFQKAELNGLLDIGCFKIVTRKMCQKVETLSGLVGAHVQGRWAWKVLENKIHTGCEMTHSSSGCRRS